MLDEGKLSRDINEIDSNYLKLKACITPVQRDSHEFKVIEKYLKNTHAVTHSAYKLELIEVFKLDRD
jgi:hypothetical protein